MKIMTLNCHSWQEENQHYKIKCLAKKIKEEQYDVIALQEISQHESSEIIDGKIKKDNYMQILLAELRNLAENQYDYVWDFSHIGYDVYEEGLAIMTKHNIKSSEAFYVSDDTSKFNYKSRKIVKASIEIEGNEFDFYSCHLGWWNDKEEPFKEQADKLLKKIKANKLSFIMGDFNNNAFVKGEGYDYLKEKGLIDTYEFAKEKDCGITVKGSIDGWKGRDEDKRLDLIMTNKEIKVKNSKVIFNTKDSIVSDHFGVEINI